MPVPGGGGRNVAHRTSRSQRHSPYEPRDPRQTSPMWDNVGQMQGAGSPIDFSPTGSSSQIVLEGSDSATSPGAESDYYRSFPNTPADTTGAMSEELDESARVSSQVLSPDL